MNKDIEIIKRAALEHLESKGIPQEMGLYMVRDTLIKWAALLSLENEHVNRTKKCVKSSPAKD